MKFALSKRMSERNVWTLLSRLVSELRPHLPPNISSRAEHAVRKRDVDALLELGEIASAQRMSGDSSINPWEFSGAYLVGSLLKKYQFTTDSSKRKAVALDGFLKAEARCAEFNHFAYRDLAYSDNPFNVGIFTYAREFISRVVGNYLPSETELFKEARHGPGSTFIASPKGKVTTYYKYADWPYTVTHDALPYAIDLIESDERWLGALQDSYRHRMGIPIHMPIDRNTFFSTVFTVVEGNRICFVPKDARKERPIAIEPSMNVMLQLGVDGYIRSRLKRWGIDLDDQSKNQRLACLGSTMVGESSPSTLDLSAASDSVSLRLIELLFPPEWYRYLCDLRSPQGTVEGREEPIVYEKISSMGNGYTFALESLLFSSIVYAVRKYYGHEWDRDMDAVYGDDIIVPCHLALAVIEALALCGFQLNLDKSFVLGNFKESCGTDWLSGTNVRPVFLSEKPQYVDELFHIHNQLAVWLAKHFFEEYVDQSPTLLYIKSLIPEDLRFDGPITQETNTHLFKRNYPIKRGVFRWRVVRREGRIWNPKDFLFRKLMHTLAPCRTEPFQNWRRKYMSASSRFEVTRRDAFDFAVRSAEVPSWHLENSLSHRP